MKVTRNDYIVSLVMITIHNTNIRVSEENGFPLDEKSYPIYEKRKTE